MSDMTFNTTSGSPVNREMLILYLNTSSTSTPTWSPIGKRVEDSSVEMDWQSESKTDIFGIVYNNVKKPVLSQSFEPCELDAGDTAQLRIWNDAIKDQDISKVVGYDCLLVHLYAGTAGTAMFAERYEGCTITPASVGGEGGGFLGMPIDVLFGGKRTVGTASITSGVVSFSEAQ